MLLGTGVQVHASFLKHHLETGIIKGRGPKESQWEQTEGRSYAPGGGTPRYLYLGDGVGEVKPEYRPGFSGTLEDGEGQKCIPKRAGPRRAPQQPKGRS